MSEIHVDSLKNKAGTGAPDFPEGVTVTGVGTITGDLSVSGTVTYDDVTSVDAVGIVTAAKGFRATAGGIHVLAGVSTFAERVSTSSSITISAGGLIVDQVNVSGVSTFGGTVDINAAIDADYGADVTGGLTADNINAAGVGTFVGLSTFADGLIVTSGLSTSGPGLTVIGESQFAVTHGGTAGTGTTISVGGINVSGIVTAYSGFDGPGNVPAGQTGSVTLAATDAGRFVSASGGITVPAATFAAGDVVSIYNNTGGNITITCSAPTAVYLGSDGSTKTSLTLTTRCICTIICVDASSNGTFVATGGGLA